MYYSRVDSNQFDLKLLLEAVGSDLAYCDKVHECLCCVFLTYIAHPLSTAREKELNWPVAAYGILYTLRSSDSTEYRCYQINDHDWLQYIREKALLAYGGVHKSSKCPVQ